LQPSITKLSCIFFALLFLLGVEKVAGQTANFTVSIPSKQGCSPLSINFTDASTGGTVATRIWDLGNTVIIPNGPATVGANYITPGKYYITLTVLFTNGVTNVKLDSIIVHPKPVADFKSIDSIGCASHTANFISLSSTATGTLTNYQWDFGAGGVTGTNPTPNFTYGSASLYQVSLIVKNSWGCTSNAETKPQYIKVFSPPTAYFTPDQYYTCSNSLTVNFTNASTGGDPTRNTYEWNFGDLSPVATTLNATHVYSGTGNYTAVLKVKLGNTCVSTYSRIIYIGKPTATITSFPTTDVCVNTPINFIGIGSANSYYERWYFPDNGQTQYYGNVTHTFTNTGTFEVMLISVNAVGCADTVRRNITVKSGPIIDFTPDLPNAACIPHTLTFTNNTVGNDLKFAWNYGDGTPVDTINGNGNATHQYTYFGTFPVTVYAKDTSTADGCFAYKTFYYIRIYQPSVTLAVVPPSGCLPLPVVLNASVYNPSGTPILNYTWDFGDGTGISTTTVPTNTHTYSTAGSFPATVTINMQGGCSYTSLVKTVTVIALCDDDGSGGGGGAGGGGFTIGKTCADKYTILFTDTVTNTIPTSWDFGDLTPPVTTGILNPISHTFPTTQKIYIVTVIRLDTITNIVTTSQKRIKIIDEKANFIPNLFDICKDKNVLFNTIGIDSSLIKNYTWDFGDGTPRFTINNAQYFSYYGVYLNGNTNHTYTTNGIFYVKLIIEDKLGCKDSLQYPLPINVAGPIARFAGVSLTSCTSPLTTTFTSASVQNGTTPITEWQWTFGDASPVLTTTVDSLIPHTYTGGTPASFYSVKLKIKDAIGCEADTTRISYVRIYKPKADFFSYNTLQCNSYQVLMYGYISQAINPTYQWDFGNGVVTTFSPTYYQYYTYPADGNYDIKLVIKDENGCMDSITKPSYINIIKPKADFKISDTLQCAPASITFADSSKYATTYLWDFGDGSGPSSSPNPAPHIYGTPGFYNVKLTITGPNGCTDVKIKPIRVRGPIGNLAVGANQGCRPYTLPLSITGGNFISTYAWDYGDGTPVVASITGASVNHTYFYAGKYLPNIVLTSPEGCPFTLKVVDTIFVDSLRAKFTTPITTFCQTSTNQTVNFTNLTTLPAFSNLLNSTWNFGDGITLSSTAATVSHTYTGYGTFNVYLATKSKYGCIDTFRLAQPIVINAKPVPTITGANVYCLKPLSILSYNGTTVSPNPIVKYIWKIDGDSVANTQNLNIDYRIPGSHLIRYIVFTNLGCVDSVDKTIIIDSVVAKYTNTPTQWCGPKLVTFTNQSTNFAAIQNYIWTYGDGFVETNTNLSPTHLYNFTGPYNVKLYMETLNGCKDSITKNATVIIDSIPKATINSAAVFCLKPLSKVAFTSTIVTQNPIVKYRWYIDNALVGNSNNLNIDYRTAGTHTISLYIETNKGCSDSVFKSFIVDSVVAKFANLPLQFCGPKLVSFTNQTTQFAATQSFYWNFGDGSALETTNLNPQHLYAYTGVYDVKLYMQTINGCFADTTMLAAVKIDSIPKATINGAAVFCLKPLSKVAFTSTIVTQNPIVKYRWYIDNALVGNSNNLNIDYRTAGTHTISLYVETNKGCSDSVFKSFIVDSVVAKFANLPLQFCGPKLVTFTNQTTQFAATQSFYWNFGDGSALETTNLNPQHLYAYTGVYDVKLYMQTINGCFADTTMLAAVKIDSIPKATINGAAVFCLKPLSKVAFTSTIVTQNPIVKYRWYIDNALVGNSNNLNIDYRTAGTHTISLYVETNKGCSDSVFKSFIVDSVVAKFANLPLQFCGPKLVTFTNQTTQFAATQSFYWNFGDGSPLETTNLNPQHLYAYTGVYDVTLYMQTINGCFADTTMLAAVKIDSIPKATINGAAVFCLKPLSRVTFTSTIVTQNPIVKYRWYIDNALVSNSNNLNIDYRTPGTHTISLYIETNKGCSDSVFKSFIVDSVVAKFANLPLQFCGPKLVTFTNQTTQFAATQSFYWNFGDNSPIETTNLNPQHLYAYTGVYDVKLYMQTINGCFADTTMLAAVKIDSIPKATINGAAVFCLKPLSRVAFISTIVTQNPIVKYRWYIDNTLVGNSNNLNIDYRTPGTHTISLYIETNKGCSDSVFKSFIVDSVVAKFANTPLQFCGPKLVTFTNQTTQFAATQSFYWNFGDGSALETTNLNPQHLYAYTGVYDVKLYMQTINGCFADTTMLAAVKIDSIPKATINGAAVFCLKPLSKLAFTSTIVTQNPIVKYRWYIDNALVGISSPTLTIDYRTPGTHTISLYIETNKGCSDSVFKSFIVDSVVAKFANLPLQFCGPKLVSFTNQTTQFAATQSFYWNFGDGSALETTNLNPQHLYAYTGVYDVKLYMQTINGCFADTTMLAAVKIDSIPKATINGAAVFCLKPLSKVAFTSTIVTQNPIVKYRWYIDNALVSNSNNLNIDYRTPGTHTISLYIETNKGCSDSVFKSFIVDSVVAKFANLPLQFCGPKLVTFTNQTTQFAATQSFYWNFGDNSPIETTNLNPQHLYAYTGSYNVKLYMQTINGCKDSITKNATVVIDSIPKPTINGAAVFCLKPASRVQFTSSVVTLNPITSYKWFIDNIQVATTQDLDIDYRTPGNHVVKLYVETGKGCNDFKTQNFIVDSIVTKYVNTPTQWCGPKLVTFTNQTTNASPIQSYVWTYGDNTPNGTTTLSPTHLYAYTGSYNVKLYMQTINGCRDSITKNATVVIDSIPKPTINGAAVFCLKPASRVQFTSSVVTLNPITSYKWFIDNIQVATTQDLDIDYRTPGNHVVKLYVETGKGCNDFKTQNFIVDSIVTKYVNTPTQWCGPKLVTFTNQTTNASPIQSYVWTYGDNTPNGTTTLSPTHLYAYTGSYNVKLYMQTINGCRDSITKNATVIIDSIPTAKITGNALECSPGNYTYSSSTSISQNPIATYQWKVDGNIVAATPNLNYNFNAGTHNINLKIIASTGCEKDTTITIKIDSLVSTFNIPIPIKCSVPSTIAFNNTAYAQFGITNYLWNFGNTSTLNNTAPNPTSIYNAAGVYPISLNITSATGCTLTSPQLSNVTIYTAPTLAITGPASACANTLLNFKGNVGGTGDQVISKEWRVNNVVVGTADSLNYLFTTAGTYTVTFNVKTQYGCDVTFPKTVTINPLPIPNAAPATASICLGSSITLSAQSGTIYSWTSPISTSGILNPGSPSTSVLPTTIGDIKYYVLVTNQFGCTKTDSVLIKVQQPINLTKSPDITICERASTQIFANGNTNIFKWSPSAGLNDSTLRNPIATPAQTTKYRVVGYSSNVCKNDTAEVVVTIQPTPTVNAGADINAIGGSTVQLNAIASSSVTNYTWTPSTRLSCNNCPNPQFINVDKTTTFKVDVFTQYGCTNSDEVTVFVLCGKGAIYIPNAFTPNGDGKNDRFSVLGYGVGKVKSFTVYDRYGQIVFQRKDYVPTQADKLNSWDGKVKGQDVTISTTFVYVAEVTCDGGESFVLKNTVILIR
jgi:gliding motility-associated-like protein